ncbi:MAG: M28 family peptidase [Kiritimatiellaeota bacterium]|nr:M28 family peptidase [Kiritimatiellota bacterium]
MIKDILQRVSADRIRHDLFYLCRDPLPFRKVNYTRPGQSMNSLAEADAFIRGQIEAAGYAVTTTTYRVQPFRCDRTKPLHHWYSTPAPSDPSFDATNLEATRRGCERPEEIIQLIAHKDSMSWIDSPGAHDNAVGTVANLELARVLATCDLRRSVRLLFCNEEHTPWTSRFAAEAAAARGDHIVAVLNVDSLDGKSEEDMAAGKMTHVVGYSTDEGRALAEFVAAGAARHKIGLDVRVIFKQHVNDDDGMFINAGFRTTVMNLGSWPYADSEYHLPGDVPERVNIANVVRSTQLLLAAILDIDANDTDNLWKRMS